MRASHRALHLDFHLTALLPPHYPTKSSGRTLLYLSDMMPQATAEKGIKHFLSTKERSKCQRNLFRCRDFCVTTTPTLNYGNTGKIKPQKV